MVLYKLLDEERKEDLELNHRISLSRPIFEYGSPEGIAFDFFRDIKKLTNSVSDISLIQPTEQLLAKMGNLCNVYKKTLSPKSYSDADVISDMRIMMCVFLKTYCGYFTESNLFEEKNLRRFFEKNSKLLKKKTHVMRMEINHSSECSIWELTQESLSANPDYVFYRNDDAKPFQNNIVAYLHYYGINYLSNKMDFDTIWSKFNSVDDRNVSAFFKYLKFYLHDQNETRLSLYLPSDQCNCEITAYSSRFPITSNQSMEEKLFYYAVSTYLALSKNCNRYVYLSIDDFQVKRIDDVLAGTAGR